MLERPAQLLLLVACLIGTWSTGCAHSELGTRFDGGGGAFDASQPWASDLDIDALEREIHRRANAERERRQLDATAWQPQLHEIAYQHSRDMARRGRFSHELAGRNFADRYERAQFRCRVPAGPSRYLTGGENLFRGHRVAQWIVYSDGRQEPHNVRSLADLAQAAVSGWMNSPPHRQNLLNPAWRTAAIGVYIDAEGWMWVTQNFC